MANETMHAQDEVTSAVAADELALWVVASGIQKRITKANLLGGSMTGSGVLATGGFTLTVPATGTAALLGTAQAFSALKTFSAGLAATKMKFLASQSINDDAVFILTPATTIGVLFVTNTGNMHTTSGFVAWRAVATTRCAIIAQVSTVIEATTGILTGTTGTDTKVTVSAHSDGNLYIENRTGAAITLRYFLLESDLP